MARVQAHSPTPDPQRPGSTSVPPASSATNGQPSANGQAGSNGHAASNGHVENGKAGRGQAIPPAPPVQRISPAAAAGRGIAAVFTPEELAEIVDRYQLAVYSFFRARVLQESDAEDLTQEVFLRFYTARNRFDDSREIRPYLLGIARNLLRERARTLRHRNEVSWTELCLEVEGDTPEIETIEDDRLDRLPQCIARLGPAARLAIELYYGARLRVQEIADRMQRSEGAVKVLLHRARQALKQCLASEEENAQDGQPRTKPEQAPEKRPRRPK